MLLTPNYLLKKIELADSPPDITAINPNWDLIDTKLKEAFDSITAIKIPVKSVNNKTGDINLVASDVGAVPTTRKVNGKVLSADITLSATDIKTTDGKTLEEFKTSTNSSLDTINESTIEKIGDMKQWAVNPPSNDWLLCDGRIINANDYPELTSFLGTKQYPSTLKKITNIVTTMSYGSFLRKIRGVVYVLGAISYSSDYAYKVPQIYSILEGKSVASNVFSSESNLWTATGNDTYFCYAGFIEGIGEIYYTIILTGDTGKGIVKCYLQIFDPEKLVFVKHKTITISNLDNYANAINCRLYAYNNDLYFIHYQGYIKITKASLNTDLTFNDTNLIKSSSFGGLFVSLCWRVRNKVIIFDRDSYSTGESSSYNLFDLETQTCISISSRVKLGFYYENGYYYGVMNRGGRFYLCKSEDCMNWEQINLSGILSVSDVLQIAKDEFTNKFYIRAKYLESTTLYVSDSIDFKSWQMAEFLTIPKHIYPSTAITTNGSLSVTSNYGIWDGYGHSTRYNTVLEYNEITGGNGDGSVLPIVSGGVTYIKAKDGVV